MSTDHLLAPLPLGPLTLPNRVVMAPLTRQRSQQPGNLPYALNASYYAQRASAGLLISEATQVCPQGQGYAWTPGIHSEAQVAGWRQVTEAVHGAGGRIYLQLWHVGRISHPLLQPGGADPVAPSAIQANAECYVQEADGSHHKAPTAKPRALDLAELPEVVSAYAEGARNAMRAGFDGVEVHAANGYLLDQFLCSNSNQRDDAYGGSAANRARLVLEVVDAVVTSVGDSRRVGIRISPMGTFGDMHDANPQETFSYLVGQLNSRNLAYLHVNRPDWLGGSFEGFDQLLRSLRALYTGTLILAGGQSAESGEQAIAEGLADLVAYGRPYIANPDLVERFAQGAALNTPDAATFYGGGAEGYTDYPTLG
ncbi:N-ethylmaleimide reductase [Pseudomonas cuatrocienegasensis]|uniref:N-ethylmaleimide reductase n=1 Tax=Pseudomonas cuatrocienegasensis TaxID=543360 RepID=A0ABY1B8N3_9PSED|nr:MULTISPECIES: alkene reductase [Pseudomonas]OEC35763.1 alkene reductase [Pseudomonas sp. 21C1]SEQ22177.1 N-ethylmaleimide reductase [Pseudomonas cuatrocienegasensis]